MPIPFLIGAFVGGSLAYVATRALATDAKTTEENKKLAREYRKHVWDKDYDPDETDLSEVVEGVPDNEVDGLSDYDVGVLDESGAIVTRTRRVIRLRKQDPADEDEYVVEEDEEVEPQFSDFAPLLGFDPYAYAYGPAFYGPGPRRPFRGPHRFPRGGGFRGPRPGGGGFRRGGRR